MSLMMHIAEHHAHELFRLSHLAAAEAPLPPSLEWGRANKAQFPDAPRKTWAMQDQASQVCAGGDGRQGKPCASCTPVIAPVSAPACFAASKSGLCLHSMRRQPHFKCPPAEPGPVTFRPCTPTGVPGDRRADDRHVPAPTVRQEGVCAATPTTSTAAAAPAATHQAASSPHHAQEERPGQERAAQPQVRSGRREPLHGQGRAAG